MCIYMKNDSFRFGPTNNEGPLNYKLAPTLLEIKSMPTDFMPKDFNKPVCYENKTECEELQSKMQCSDCLG